MQLPNMSALRLGAPAPAPAPAPEPAPTGGKMITYRAAGARAHPYRRIVSGRGECIVSGDDFEENDRVWQSNSGHLYRPWAYYRAAKSMGWRDCQSNEPVSPCDQKRLEVELDRLINHNGPHATPEAAREANRVAALAREALAARVVPRRDPPAAPDDDEEDEEDDETDSDADDDVPPYERGVWNAFGYNERDYEWRGEHLRSEEWSLLRRSSLFAGLDGVWVPDQLMQLVVAQHANQLQRLGVPETRGYEWTNPLALNGNLRIWWTNSEDLRTVEADVDVGAAPRRNKTSRFELTLPLSHGKVLTKLVLGIGSPNYSINGVRGSRTQLSRFVLRALLLGNRSGQDAQSSYVLDEQDVLRFEDALSSHDFEIEFCPQVASYVELLVYVSVPLMRLLVTAPMGVVRPQDRNRPNLRTLLNQFVGARRGERLPVPRPAEAWGNLQSDAVDGLPPGWMPNSSPHPRDRHAFQQMELALAAETGRRNPFPNGVDAAFCSRAHQNWKAGAVRMVQTANNLVMFALGFDNPTGIDTAMPRPTDAPQPYYLGQPADAVEVVQGTSSMVGPEWSLVGGFEARARRSGPHQGYHQPPRFLEMSCEIDIPFWYGIDSARVVHGPPTAFFHAGTLFDRVASGIVGRDVEGPRSPPSPGSDDGGDDGGEGYFDARDA